MKLRPNEKEAEAIELLKEFYGENTATRAIAIIARLRIISPRNKKCFQSRNNHTFLSAPVL